MTIGNRMKEIRGKLGMTQAELAEELDIDEKRLFKDFLELFDFEANGIYRVHDFTCADGILIGRKMESVIE